VSRRERTSNRTLAGRAAAAPLSGAGAAASIQSDSTLSGLPQEVGKNLKAYEAFTPPSGRGVAYDFRLVRVVAKIARGFKEHDLKEASLSSNAGEGRCLRWPHDFPFSRLESAMGATMAHHQ
jgi:hypothetical protein